MIFAGRDPFRWITTGVMLLFSLVVAGVFLADFFYVDAASMKEVATSREIRQAFFLSLYTSILTTLFSILIAVPTAYALSRYRFKGIVIFDTLVDILIVLPVLIIGVSLLVFFRMGTEMGQSGILPVRWAGALVSRCGEFFIYTKAGIVLAQFFCAAPYAIRIIKTTFDEIGTRTENVAMTLGCTRAGAFRHVTLPLARHGILAGTVLSWVRAYGVFGAVTMVAGAVRGRTEVLPTAIYLEVSIGRIEVALAISIVMMITAALVLIGLRAISGRALFGAAADRRARNA
jgi:molybdate transport system permease protein